MQSAICVIASIIIFAWRSGSVVSGMTPELTCGDSVFRCRDGSHCVGALQLCDYIKDCNDASDEDLQLCRSLKDIKGGCSHGKVKCSCASRDYSYLRNQCVALNMACSAPNECLCNEKRSICELIKNNILPANPDNCQTEEKESDYERLLTFLTESFNKTLDSNQSCPLLYNHFDSGRCVSIFSPAKVTWKEADLFCRSIAGELATINSVSNFDILLQFLHENEIYSDFWIGGYNAEVDLVNGTEWLWLNGEDVPMRAPYWAIDAKWDKQNRKSIKVLMPVSSESGRCIGMKTENFYYFSDEDCNGKASPICFYPPSLHIDQDRD